jgi:hypothetical protein
MEYVNIGTDKLLSEYFICPMNSDKKLKPAGGLWTTSYCSPYFNEWIDFLIQNPDYYGRYIQPGDPFRMTGAIVSIKSNARIFNIRDLESFSELANKYNFDFERVALDYDGIYVEPYHLTGINSSVAKEMGRLFAVKTLSLFDLSIIESYRKVLFSIDNFDYTSDYGNDVSYEGLEETEKQLVVPESLEYQQMLEVISKKLKNFIFNLRRENPNFSSNQIVHFVNMELKRLFGKEIMAYAERKGLDGDKIAYSMASKSLRKIK